jgi:hypothetical protein
LLKTYHKEYEGVREEGKEKIERKKGVREREIEIGQK